MSSTTSGWTRNVSSSTRSASGELSPISTHIVRPAACAARITSPLDVRSTLPSTMMCASMSLRGRGYYPAEGSGRGVSAAASSTGRSAAPGVKRRRRAKVAASVPETAATATSWYMMTIW